MLFLIIFLIVGVSLGLVISKISIITKTSEKVLTFLLYPVLFLLGIIFRVDDKVVSNIELIGWNFFIYIIAALALLFGLIWFVYKLVFHAK